jgi:hypothetical protein
MPLLRRRTSTSLLTWVPSPIIFGQANVTIDIVAALNPLSLRATLPELVMEQRARTRQQRAWDELIAAADSSAHMNVFFMKWQGTPGKLPSPIVEHDTNVIFEDGMPIGNVLTALAHRIGLFLGCQLTTNDRQVHHLMHASRADGVTRGPAGVHFISRDCNNQMNISGVNGIGT